MTAATPVYCADRACNGKQCPRTHHRWTGLTYGGCTTHRRCERFEVDELPALDVADPTDSPAGAVDVVLGVLLSGRCWYCPACLNCRELPRRCCGTDLIEAEVTVRRRTDA